MKIVRTICLLGIVAAFFAAPADCAPAYMLEPAGKIGIGGGGWMSFVAFSPDGKMVASDGPAKPDDVSGALTVWTFPGGRFVKHISSGRATLSPTWKFLETQEGIKKLSDDAPVPVLAGSADNYGVFSQDDRFLAVLHSKRSNSGPAIRIVSLPSGRQTKAFGASSPFSVAFSPDDNLLAEGHWDSVALWDITSGKRIAMLRGFARYIDGIAFSPHGTLLAVGTDLGTLQVWNIPHRKRLFSIDLQGGDVSDPAFSPDGKLVVVGVYGTGEVFLIDARRGKLLGHERVSGLGCGSVAFSPDGRYLITPSTGGLVTWPYDQGGTIRVFRVVRR